jgi:hypothetical protein
LVAEPSPYCTLSLLLSCRSAVEDLDGSYLLCLAHAFDLQSTEGIQVSEDPVSKSRVKACAGVPMLTGPAQTAVRREVSYSCVHIMLAAKTHADHC